MWELIRQNLLATYAAIIATINLIWNIYEIQRDRVRIVLKFEKDIRLFSERTTYPYKPDTDYSVLTVINRGRRPIKITQAGAHLYRGKKKYVIFTDSYAIPGTRILTETSPSTDFLCEQSLLDLNNIEYVYARDGTGRTYKRYIHKFPTFWKLFNKLKK